MLNMAKLGNGFLIPLKKLNSFEDLSKEQIKSILLTSNFYLTDIYNWLEKPITLDFSIKKEDHSFSGSNFEIRSIENMDEEEYSRDPEPPDIFVSDFLSFVEQIRTELPQNKNFDLDLDQKNYLEGIGSIFLFFNIDVGNFEKIKKEDLVKIEKNSGQASEKIDELIKKILEVKAFEQEVEEVEETEKTEKKEEANYYSGSGTSSQTNEEKKEQREEKDSEQKKEELKDQKRDFKADFSQEFNLARLDPESKNYLQYLSIITINQTLNRYFDDATLQKLGLTEIPTFDSLPLDVRQKLMTSAFTQIEGLLVGGQYNLADLISKPSTRLSLASAASIDLMMDVNAMHSLNQSVRQLAKKELPKEQEQQITKERQEELEKFKKEVEEAKKKGNLSKKEAEKIIEQSKTSFFTLSEDQFIDKLAELTKNAGRDQAGTDLLTKSNVLPTIDTFIQEGFPVEFVQYFDYKKFSFYFGDEIIDEKTFLEHEEEIKNLFIVYWKSRRTQLANLTRQEVAWEKIDLEETNAIWDDITSSPESLEKHFKMMQYHRQINLTYGGATVTGVLAGQATDDPILQLYQEAQQSTHLNNLKREFEEYLRTGSQQSYQQITIYYEYYFHQPAPQVINMTDYNDIATHFNPYDLYAIAANQDMGMSAFTQGENGLPYLPEQFQGQGGLREALENSPIGQAGDMLAKEALKYGLRAGIDAISGGTAEAAFQAWDAAKAAAPILQELEDEVLNKLLEWIKKYGPYLAAAAILMSLIPLAGLLIAPIGLYFALKNMGGLGGLFGKNGGILGGKAGKAASRTLGQGSATRMGVNLGTNAAQTATAQTATATTATGTGLGSTAMATASQAVIGTVAITAGATLFYRANLENAFLTHFPAVDPYTNTLNSKKSKYASLEKTAKIIEGCPSPESEGKKCENPNFPVSIKYEIEIKPKKDYTIQITNIEDNIKFRQSEKGWEEIEGRVPPTIEESTSFKLDDFEEIKDADDLILEPGESLILEYEVENLSSNYNHTAIINTAEIKFYYENSFESGTDTAKTSARICLGECGMGAGCWPTTGNITQLPFGVGTPDSDASHRPPLSGGYADAYDIADGVETYPNIYTPFAGELCFAGCSDKGFGCHYNLKFDGGTLKFAHFEEEFWSGCKDVEEGFLIGPMGNRGNSTGTHLHFELYCGDTYYACSGSDSSVLESLMPETIQGNQPAQLHDSVVTCYE
jgi:hypothetical protein